MPTGGAMLKPGMAGALFQAALGGAARRQRIWPFKVWISRPWKSETKAEGRPKRVNPPMPGGQATLSQQMTFSYRRSWLLERRFADGATLNVEAFGLRQLAQLTFAAVRANRQRATGQKKRMRRLQLANTVLWTVGAITALHPAWAAFDAAFAVFAFSSWIGR